MSSDDELRAEWSWVTSDGQLQDEPPSDDNAEQSYSDTEGKVDISKKREIDEMDSDTSSDVETIDEAILEDTNETLIPEFNIVTQYTADKPLEYDEHDEVNNQLVPIENLVDLHIDQFRRNRRINNRNFWFSVAMAFTLCLTSFFGVLYLIESRNHNIQTNREFQDSNVAGEKQSQNDRDVTLNTLTRWLHQNKDTVSSILCYRKVKYWKRQFEDLSCENQDLLLALSDESSIINKCDQELQEQQEKLKIDLFHEHIEHAEALKQFEIIRQHEQFQREKVKSLEDENEDLKLKLQTDDDDLDDEKVLHFLMKENVKFRIALEAAEKSMQTDDQVIQVEVDALRQKINQLHVENEDLRQVIARLRYGRPYEPTEKQNKINRLQTENGELKMEIDKIRYSKSQEIESVNTAESDNERLLDPNNSDGLKDVIDDLQNPIDVEKNQSLKWQKLYQQMHDDLNVSYSKWKLLDVLQETTGKMSSVLRKIGIKIVKKFDDVVNKTNDAILDGWINNVKVNLSEGTMQFLLGLHKKWNDPKREVFEKMNRVLKDTTSTLVNSVQFIDVNKTKEVITNVINNVWKLVGNLNELSCVSKCQDESENAKRNKKTGIQEPKNGKPKQDKHHSVEYNNDHVGKDGQDEMKSRADWMFRRAQSRKEKHQKQKQVDWLFARAKDREQQREIHNDHDNQRYERWSKKKGDRGDDIDININWYLKKSKRTQFREKIKKTQRYNQNQGKFAKNKFERKSLKDRPEKYRKTFSHEDCRFDHYDGYDDDNICQNKIRPCAIHVDGDQETLFGR